MGSSSSREEAKGEVKEMEVQNGGFNVFEFHGQSAALTIAIMVGLLCLVGAICCCTGPIHRLYNRWQQQQRLRAIAQEAAHARQLRLAEEEARQGQPAQHHQPVQLLQHPERDHQNMIELNPARQEVAYNINRPRTYTNYGLEVPPAPARPAPPPTPTAPATAGPAGVWDAVTAVIPERARTPHN